jgi:paraquat-inducible protein A
MGLNAPLICHLCGQEYRAIRLEPGEKALCVRCDAVLAQGVRARSHTALVFAITGLALAWPAALLPFVSAGKFGAERISLLFTGVRILWNSGMRALAVLVLLCGGLLPLAYLVILAVLHAPTRLDRQKSCFRLLVRSANGLEHWAIPEVQVLAVLVAMIKLGSIVNVAIGSGFWCYCAMVFSLLIAQHTSRFNPTVPLSAAGATGAAVPL